MRIITKLKFFPFLILLLLIYSSESKSYDSKGLNKEIKLKIVATVPSLAAIAKSIAKDKVEVKSLARHNEDPHYVSAKPSMILTLNRADLLIVNGVDLEIGWIPVLLSQARNSKIQKGQEGYLDASMELNLSEVRKIKISRSMGDIHPGGNPHFSYDPFQMIKIAYKISKRLSTLDPSHSSEYLQNFMGFSKNLKNFALAKQKKFLALPASKRQLVVYHNSLVYLFDWLKLYQIGTLEPKPGIAPNPSHISKLLKKMRAKKSKFILQESFYPRSTSKTLAKMINGRLIVIDGGTRFRKGETYLNHLNRISEEIYAAISK